MKTKVLLVLLAAAAVIPIGFAVADSGGGDDGSELIPAADCPEAAAVYEQAGLPVDTFSPECPTRAEAEATLQEREQALQGLAARKAQTERDLEVALERVRAGELQSDIDPRHAERVLEDILALRRDRSDLIEQDADEFEETAARVLDELRDSGDYPPLDDGR
jgi:hypothetical protein